MTNRWFNAVRLSADDWLPAIKMFELELSALKASKQLGLSYYWYPDNE